MLAEEIQQSTFAQFLLFRPRAAEEYAESSIRLIGDVPFYVSPIRRCFESELFLLDEDPAAFVAGAAGQFQPSDSFGKPSV